MSKIASLREDLKGSALATQAAVTALLAALPEDLRKPFEPVNASLTETIAKLSAPEADADKENAALTAAVQSVAGFNKELVTQFNALVAQLNTVKAEAEARKGEVAQLNSAVEGYKAQIANGELVAKATVEGLVTAARDEAHKAGAEEAAQRLGMLTTRKAELQKCGLPLPKDENLLLGKDEEFNALQQTAKTRMEELRKRGVVQLNGPVGDMASEAVFGDEANFTNKVKLLDDLKIGRSTNPRPEPAAGGGGAGRPKGAI